MSQNVRVRTRQVYHRKRIAYLTGIWLAAAIFLWQATAMPPPSRPTPVEASTFPTIVGIIMVISATGMLVQAVWSATHPPETKTDDELEIEEATAESGPNGEELVASKLRLAVALAATAAYVALFFPLGYLLSTIIYIAGMTIYFWRRPVASLVIAVLFTIAVAWLFSLLGIGLPAGLISLKF